MFMPATEQLEFSYIPVRVKKKKKNCKSVWKTVCSFVYLNVHLARQIYKKICTRLFIEALFLKAKSGNKPKVHQQEND